MGLPASRDGTDRRDQFGIGVRFEHAQDRVQRGQGVSPFGERPLYRLYLSGEVSALAAWCDDCVGDPGHGPGLAGHAFRVKFPWWRLLHNTAVLDQ